MATLLSGRQDCYGYEVNRVLEQHIKSEFPKLRVTAGRFARELGVVEQTYRGVSCQAMSVQENARMNHYFSLPMIVMELEDN